MSLPALRAVRVRFPDAHITLLARPWVAEVYHRETFADRVELYDPARGTKNLLARLDQAKRIGWEHFDAALLLPNSFESAAFAWFAGIPRRIGYARDGRGLLLTDRIPVPDRASIPRFEAFYYLELLRRLGWIDSLPSEVTIRLERMAEAGAAGRDRFTALGLHGEIVGVSPGAAFGGAKRWLPERFAEAAVRIATGPIALFGSASERVLCESVADQIRAAGVQVHNFAGETTLREFIEFAAACRVFLTNDSGSMHVASAAGVPTVAVFGATDHIATGPTGDRARVVREPVDCSPCLKRECPIDHRCMTRVTADQVAEAALILLK